MEDRTDAALVAHYLNEHPWRGLEAGGVTLCPTRYALGGTTPQTGAGRPVAPVAAMPRAKVLQLADRRIARAVARREARQARAAFLAQLWEDALQGATRKEARRTRRLSLRRGLAAY